MTRPLRVRRLAPDARLPSRAHPGDAGLDLHALDEVVLAPGERCAVRTGLAVEMQEQGTERELYCDLQRAVIRIVCEALRNVAQHAGARHATVALRYGEAEVTVTVTDDGSGFDAEATAATAEASGHFGLVGMRERAEGVGGRLVVTTAIGNGTTVQATIPYERSQATVSALRTEPFAIDEAMPERPGILARLFGR